MTATADRRVNNAAERAKEEARSALKRDKLLHKPIADFCDALVEWVFYGNEPKPYGEPTGYVRGLVKEAINGALDAEYGDKHSPQIDLGIRGRRGAL